MSKKNKSDVWKFRNDFRTFRTIRILKSEWKNLDFKKN